MGSIVLCYGRPLAARCITDHSVTRVKAIFPLLLTYLKQSCKQQFVGRVNSGLLKKCNTEVNK